MMILLIYLLLDHLCDHLDLRDHLDDEEDDDDDPPNLPPP